MTDPIVAEVRHARMEHTRKFDYNLDAICEDLKKVEAECGHKVVRLTAKRIQRTTPSRAMA